MSAEAIVSIIGPGSAEACLAARALVSVNGVAHRWLDTEQGSRGSAPCAAGRDRRRSAGGDLR